MSTAVEKFMLMSLRGPLPRGASGTLDVLFVLCNIFDLLDIWINFTLYLVQLRYAIISCPE